jgi:hypothetical protein
MAATDPKIMGFIPKDKYMQFAYAFLLVSAAGNVLYSLLAIVGISFASAFQGVTVLGFLALILAVIGLTVQKDQFSALDHAHFKYIALLFAVFFVIFVAGGGLYALSYTLGYLGTIVIGAAQTVLTWTGLSSHQDGHIITRENLKQQIKIAAAKR